MTDIGIFFGTLSQKQKEQVIEEVAEEAAIKFQLYCDTLEDGVALKKLRGDELLMAYRSRAPEIWARLRATDPRAYTSQRDEWGKMESRRLRQPDVQATRTAEAQTTPYLPTPQIGGF